MEHDNNNNDKLDLNAIYSSDSEGEDMYYDSESEERMESEEPKPEVARPEPPGAPSIKDDVSKVSGNSFDTSPCGMVLSQRRRESSAQIEDNVRYSFMCTRSKHEANIALEELVDRYASFLGASPTLQNFIDEQYEAQLVRLSTVDYLDVSGYKLSEVRQNAVTAGFEIKFNGKFQTLDVLKEKLDGLSSRMAKLVLAEFAGLPDSLRIFFSRYVAERLRYDSAPAVDFFSMRESGVFEFLEKSKKFTTSAYRTGNGAGRYSRKLKRSRVEFEEEDE